MEFICVSYGFFFVCFIVVLIGGSYVATPLWESVFEVGVDAINALLVVHVVNESLAKNAAHNLQMRRIEV